MHNSKHGKRTAPVNVSETDSRNFGLGIGSRIAPAVALLMLGDSAYAQDSEDGTIVPEPSVLALLAAGVVIGGAAKYVRNKRRKK